jgi:lipopolysaccharide/colanic/teichoic acid biosynthesis glycosyltransferase
VLSKRIFDCLAAFIGLLLLLPLFVLISFWIKLDSAGPVFFKQERVGRHGVVFCIFKFRTMMVNTESKGQITVGRDARITHIGHMLRRYKIDELPQLINVLFGEMSLVGPRPEVPRYVARYPHHVRDIVLSVPPGITDWASIEYKEENAILGSAVDPERAYVEEILPIKLDYYVSYVRQRSFLMDLRIIFATFAAIIH